MGLARHENEWLAEHYWDAEHYQDGGDFQATIYTRLLLVLIFSRRQVNLLG